MTHGTSNRERKQRTTNQLDGRHAQRARGRFLRARALRARDLPSAHLQKLATQSKQCQDVLKTEPFSVRHLNSRAVHALFTTRTCAGYSCARNAACVRSAHTFHMLDTEVRERFLGVMWKVLYILINGRSLTYSPDFEITTYKYKISKFWVLTNK